MRHLIERQGTSNPLKGLELADHLHNGIVHINDQTVNDEAVALFGGVRDSGTGARLGGPTAKIEAFTETQRVTLRSEIPTFPFRAPADEARSG